MLIEQGEWEMFRGGVVDDSFLSQALTAFHAGPQHVEIPQQVELLFN